MVCLASAQRDNIVARARLDPARVHTVLLGADVDWFSPRPNGGGDGYVLTVGKDLARDLATFAAAVAPLGTGVEVVAHPRTLTDVRPVVIRRHLWHSLPPRSDRGDAGHRRDGASRDRGGRQSRLLARG